ncbi:MAG: hypothetical protein A2583_11750 [Bdellovibrionales bacterium RIFOXYD1_FULL_53_11]|nr:MAG: hypothetical protein A2583_11750 [Bdellovibrionales bacterium RIFOXYD1_FULL_53_11]
MGGLDFKAEAPREQEDESSVRYNTRIGVLMFFVYVLFYAGFMGLSAFAPDIMGTPWMGGINLSITYGFALIVAAIVLALIYMALCRKNKGEGSK